MGKIIAINKSKTISFRDDVIEYFEEVNSVSKKEGYQNIIDKIKNATSTVKIASTSMVDEQIIDAVHENKKINTYIILKNFDVSSKTVERFDERKVAIIREVGELENNFILIDNVAYLFVNPLEESKNISFYFDEVKASDLEFIFNYYFWNRAIKEKLVNDINTAIESPFPPFGLRTQKTINVIEAIKNEFKELYIPRDKKFDALLEKDTGQKYFSDDISVPLYLNDNNFIVGLFQINKEFSIEISSWELKENKLEDIDSSLEIILREESLSNPIKIEEHKNIELKDIVSPSIEEMDNQEPYEYSRDKYVKEVTYNWIVMPPKKPKNSKKSSLYQDHENFKNKRKKLEEERDIKKSSITEKKENISKLDKKDKEYQKNLKQLKKEIETLEKQLTKKENFSKPKHSLPSDGILYELDNKYFLEISNEKELAKAKDYIKKEKLEDKCKIVVL